MIRETYMKGYSSLIWVGTYYQDKGKYYYRKCGIEGYLQYEDSGDMFYMDFIENLKTMKGYEEVTNG